ncbi:MAG: YgiT-type zinc finger protein [Lachnospiraceae bacterium]|nr:YgiT-type zinc finger protein [Lachnospiraceae bacterium]
MKCMKCRKEIFKSRTTEAIELEFGVLVIRNIPCYKCVECDEIFYTGDVAQKIEEITERVKLFIQEITVVDYEKAA